MSNFKFTDRDYSSDGGMMTTVWGPALWHVLHTISFNYPVNPTEEHKKAYFNWLMSLKEVLPCCYCRDNYKTNLKAAHLAYEIFDNRDTFSRFIYTLHNEVNKRLGKPVYSTYEDVRDTYEHFRSRCNKTSKTSDTNDTTKELGCTNPAAGIPTKCAIRIVPGHSKHRTFTVDRSCYECGTKDDVNDEILQVPVDDDQ